MIITNGILGKGTKKIGNVVGATWKDKNYLRSYVKPANPNTSAQQLWRNSFKKLVHFVQGVVAPWLNGYLDWQIKGMSGFNYVIKQSAGDFFSSDDYGDVGLMYGKLTAATADEAVTSLTPNTLTVKWNTSLTGNASTDDMFKAAVFCPTTDKWYFSGTDVERSVGQIDVLLDATAIAETCNCFYFAYAEDATPKIVMCSNSTHIQFVP